MDTETLYVVSGLGNEWRSALEFDISSISPGVVINSATLNLFGMEADENIGVHSYTGNGTLEIWPISLSHMRLCSSILLHFPGMWSM